MGKKILSMWVAESDGDYNGQPVYDIWQCGSCGIYPDELQESTDYPIWRYRPYCGAKMKTEEEVRNETDNQES